jgi:hypothetical protein
MPFSKLNSKSNTIKIKIVPYPFLLDAVDMVEFGLGLTEGVYQSTPPPFFLIKAL